MKKQLGQKMLKRNVTIHRLAMQQSISQLFLQIAKNQMFISPKQAMQGYLISQKQMGNLEELQLGANKGMQIYFQSKLTEINIDKNRINEGIKWLIRGNMKNISQICMQFNQLTIEKMYQFLISSFQSLKQLFLSIHFIQEFVLKCNYCESFVDQQDQDEDRNYMKFELLFVSGTVLVILQRLQYYTIVCYFGVISSGFFLSVLYALFFTMAQAHGYNLSQSAAANMTICSVLAEGMLVTPIGYLIGEFEFKAFIYAIFDLLLILQCLVLQLILTNTWKKIS